MNITDTQNYVLNIIENWCKDYKEPISKKQILSNGVNNNQFKLSTIEASIKALIRKGYIRKTIKGAAYIQLRTR